MTRPLHPYERRLGTFNGVLFLPASGAVGTGAGLGTTWVVTGAPTITHPAPTTTSAATQLKRTVYSELVAGANQVLGPSSADLQFWKGNSVISSSPPTPPLGGYYFSCCFTIEAWAAATGRIFIGLSNAATNPVTVDAGALVGDLCGLYHDTTHGADELYYVNRESVTTTTTILSSTVTVANCSTAGSSTTLSTSASFASVAANSYITGAGVTAGTRVVSKASNTSLTMSAAMTVAAGTTLTFNPVRIAAGQAFLWEMWSYPSGDSYINTNYRLTNINTAILLSQSVSGGGPRAGIFVAPQATMSNGADLIAGNYGLGVANLYVANYPFPYLGNLLIQ